MFKHYNMKQVVLPLNLEIKLDKNDDESMSVKIVQGVPYVLNVQMPKKETNEKFTLTKNGNNKKHIRKNSFRKKKLVRFTENVKLM